MPPGCRERVTLEFVAFILRTRRSARARHAALWRDPPAHVRAHRLRTPREVRDFLDSLPMSGPGA
jgi:hypothetical protein